MTTVILIGEGPPGTLTLINYSPTTTLVQRQF